MASSGIKRLLKKILFHDVWLARRDARILAEWERSGRPVPPPHVAKQRAIAAAAKRSGALILIETGTYLGDMVGAMRRRFREIHSIELSDELARKAAGRFEGEPHIHIHQGDSGQVLPSILAGVREPCVLWLDGHFSGGITARASEETPIQRELKTVLAHPVKGHVVLIDDARFFNGENDYPTLAKIEAQIRAARPDWKVVVKDDIIRAGSEKCMADS
ncbi:MAG TPA: hypothetical protein VIH35_07165 [Kiritimatiellia bacterium]|jgi:hypothetical protein